MQHGFLYRIMFVCLKIYPFIKMDWHLIYHQFVRVYFYFFRFLLCVLYSSSNDKIRNKNLSIFPPSAWDNMSFFISTCSQVDTGKSIWHSDRWTPYRSINLKCNEYLIMFVSSFHVHKMFPLLSHKHHPHTNTLKRFNRRMCVLYVEKKRENDFDLKLIHLGYPCCTLFLQGASIRMNPYELTIEFRLHKN